mmetsp:Transcript_5442/g.6208  ORF Transcript_5442/g.6208 Transcript_5442/m.6208 type:complete len:451 (+) Transcript_5442:105-1457(+)
MNAMMALSVKTALKRFPKSSIDSVVFSSGAKSRYCVMSSSERIGSFNPTTRISPKQQCFFSIRNLTSLNSVTPAEKKEEDNDSSEGASDYIRKPANLVFDRRSTCTPFFGMEKVDRSSHEDENDKDEEDKEIDATETDDDSQNSNIESTTVEQEESDVDEDDDDEYDDDDDDRVEEWFDVSTKPQLDYIAIPLPDRLHVPVHSFTETESEEVGTLALSPEIFGCDPIRPDILHRNVVYLRNKKRGKRFPAITKTVSEVSGSGKKARPQKGTGAARAGKKRAAHWRGGAKAHGPKGVVQDYTSKLNKKVRKMGMRHMLSQKLKEGNLILINDFNQVTSYKTKNVSKVLEKFLDIGGRSGTHAYIVDAVDNGRDAVVDVDETSEATDDVKNPNPIKSVSVAGVDANFMIATRNLYHVKLVNNYDANIYDILNTEKLVLTLAAVAKMEKHFAE